MRGNLPACVLEQLHNGQIAASPHRRTHDSHGMGMPNATMTPIWQDSENTHIHTNTHTQTHTHTHTLYEHALRNKYVSPTCLRHPTPPPTHLCSNASNTHTHTTTTTSLSPQTLTPLTWQLVPSQLCVSAVSCTVPLVPSSPSSPRAMPEK